MQKQERLLGMLGLVLGLALGLALAPELAPELALALGLALGLGLALALGPELTLALALGLGLGLVLGLVLGLALALGPRPELGLGLMLGLILDSILGQLKEWVLRHNRKPQSADTPLAAPGVASPDPAQDVQPPKLARRLLDYLPEQDREEIIGDLEEEFADRLARSGRTLAVEWYRDQVRTTIWSYLMQALKRLAAFGRARLGL